jgi:hypothetical protein
MPGWNPQLQTYIGVFGELFKKEFQFRSDEYLFIIDFGIPDTTIVVNCNSRGFSTGL